MVSNDQSTVAIIADVHGNRWALEAVLEDIDRRGGPTVLNLGDSVYGPLDPAGTTELLRRVTAVSIRGNQDRVLLEPDEATADSPTFRFVVGQLSAEDMAWLGRHEVAPVRVDTLALCHGTPERDDRYLIERVTEHAVVPKERETLTHELASIDASIVLCGHSHVPRLLGLSDGRLVVNPGSVGLPAYTEDAPYPHAMESGSPHARYVILQRTDTGWNVEHVAVVYDWERAASTAERCGRPDWALWLRSGRASVSGAAVEVRPVAM